MVKQNIIYRFKEVAEKYSEKIAISHKDRSVTYMEVDKISNIIGGYLDRTCFTEKKTVAIMDTGPELVEVLFGILKSNGIFIPLSPDNPVERINDLIKIVEADCIIISKKYWEKYIGIKDAYKDLRVVIIDDVDSGAERIEDIKIFELNDNLPINNEIYDNNFEYVEQNEHCYIYFTSGSTGAPNAVLGRHKSLYHFIDWEIKEMNVTESSNITQLTPIAFDPFLRDIFVPLCAGGTLCIPDDKEMILHPNRFNEWIENKSITHIHMVPSLFKILFSNLDNSYRFSHLKYILLAGELLKVNDIKKFVNNFENIQLVNMYGPTEATLAKVFYRITKDDLDKSIIPVGKAISETQVYILNDNLKKCAKGIVGEIYIRTPHMSAGYYNNKELTDRKFMINPFTQNPKDIIYATGDLGKHLYDGNIEVLGRKDTQTKIRGIRIEVSEIENKLLEFDGIKETVIICKTGNDDNKYLCAFFVGNENLKNTDLRKFLLNYFPEFMVPLHFIRLESIPYNNNGKINRKILETYEIKNLDEDNNYTKPVSEIETILEKIWANIFAVDNIGVNKDFILLGGHSLIASKIVTEIYKELKIEVPILEIFKNPTIKELANYIETKKPIDNNIIPIAKVKEYYIASPSQIRFYLFQQQHKRTTLNNVTHCMIVKSNIQLQKLQEAIQTIISIQDSLRTSFDEIDGKIVYKIKDYVEFNINIQEKENQNIDTIIQDSIQPFDLSVAPLFRINIVKINDQEQLIIFDMHHIISDIISMRILMNDIFSLYIGNKVEEPKIQYKDYSEWIHTYDNSKRINSVRYWLSRLEGELPTLNLPYDFSRPTEKNYSGDICTFVMNKDMTQQFREIVKNTGCTSYMFILASINVLFYLLTEQDDIIIGSPVSGRMFSELEHIIGAFINVLPIRNKICGNQRYIDFLNDVKLNVLESLENQEYQFDEMVMNVKLNTDSSRSPIFDVMFSMLSGFQNQDLAMEEIQTYTYEFGNKQSRYDITFFADDSGEQLTLCAEFCTKIFKKETIQGLLINLGKIIGQVVTKSDVLIKDIGLISSEDKKKILHDFNNNSRQYNREKAIHELFEEQVEKTPDKIAIECNDSFLTYKELNSKSNSLARALIECGTITEDIIGVMLEPSLEMFIAILGILKSGAAYLPIDIQYPDERVEYMLSNCIVKIIITSRLMNNHELSEYKIIDINDEFKRDFDTSNLGKTCHSNNMIYNIFTSGSTGKPKAVMIEHRAIHNMIEGVCNEININPDDTILNLTNICFDIFAVESFLPLVKGLKIVIADTRNRLDYNLLKDLLKNKKINILQMTPSSLKMILALEDVSFLKNIKNILVGGEELPFSLLKKLREASNASIYNMYGPTETTVWSTMADVTKCDRVHIGKPIQNTYIYILDSHLNLRPINAIGTMYIGGEGLSRGYNANETLTDKRFIKNPFREGELIYDTGDLAKWNEDGTIDFIGRNDFQVKIRGHRIELSEIESVIRNLENISDVVVLAKDNGKDKYLTAYIVEKKKGSVVEIKEKLAEFLPNYMIPSSFIVIDSIPLNTSGKINRNELMKLEEHLDIKTILPPRNYQENIVTNICKNVIGCDQISIDDNFFEIGGNSINIMQVANEINKQLNINIPIATLMSERTIAGIANALYSYDNNGVEYKNVFKINKSNNDRKIFIIHGAGGDIFYYRKFAEKMEEYCSVYGVQPKGLNGREMFPTSYYKMINDYVGEIRRIQSEGPYIIAGYCIGGNIAYDIVNLLELQGEEVTVLIEIDHEAFLKRETFNAVKRNYVMLKSLEHTRKLLNKDKMFTIESFAKLKLKQCIISKEYQLELLNDKEKLKNFFGRELVIKSDYTSLGFVHSPVVVIRAKENSHKLLNYEAWRNITKGSLEFYQVSGNHESILLSPNVDEVVNIIKKYMD